MYHRGYVYVRILYVSAVEHAARNEVLQARTYDTLQLQIWSLLPGFCTNPTDFDTVSDIST